MYNPDRQYRCTIIRGKAQSDLDNLLPLYANIINKLCPCEKDYFHAEFNDELSQFFFNKKFSEIDNNHKKTIRNHITEIAGKLFGLHYENAEYAEISKSCKLLIQSGDHPAFFKNLCLNFQFPNATQKLKTVEERITHKIRFKPFHFIISLLDLTYKQGKVLSKQEIAYYVLNSLDVLQGNVTIEKVYETIMVDRQKNVEKPILKGSHDFQHINEQFNLLELANLIKQDNGFIYLNSHESTVINLFKQERMTPFFDIYLYHKNGSFLESTVLDWSTYYGSVKYDYNSLKTTQESLNADTLNHPFKAAQTKGKLTTVQIGDKGELHVYEMEKERVRNYKERLINKVLLLGKTRGLGYDISSIEAEGEEPEFARYIEVKTTIRVTAPKINETWKDTVILTAKEWIAAKQYGTNYNIYRVYFMPNFVKVYRVQNPYEMYKAGQLDVFPTMYQMDLRHSNIGELI